MNVMPLLPLDRPGGFRLIEAAGPAALHSHLEAWRALARRALEPNVFYEPECLLTNMRHFGAEGQPRALLIYGAPRGEPERLVGLFPLTERATGPGRLLRQYQLFSTRYMWLSTPLLDRDLAAGALTALLDWLDCRPASRSLLGFKMTTADGPFWRLLADLLRERDQPCLVRNRYHRAFLAPATSTDAYLRTAFAGKRRKELRRLRRRLAERGPLRFVAVAPGEDIEPWIERFLALEASGWKGRAGTALARLERDRGFFRELLLSMHAQGRLLTHALVVGDGVAALKFSFRDPGPDGGSYAFKIAYDEAFAQFSPGVLLELEVVRLFHEDPCLPAWMDSCAVPDHPMIDRVWTGRREIGYLLCGARTWRNRVLFRFLVPLASPATGRRSAA